MDIYPPKWKPGVQGIREIWAGLKLIWKAGWEALASGESWRGEVSPEEEGLIRSRVRIYILVAYTFTLTVLFVYVPWTLEIPAEKLRFDAGFALLWSPPSAARVAALYLPYCSDIDCTSIASLRIDTTRLILLFGSFTALGTMAFLLAPGALVLGSQFWGSKNLLEMRRSSWWPWARFWGVLIAGLAFLGVLGDAEATREYHEVITVAAGVWALACIGLAVALYIRR